MMVNLSRGQAWAIESILGLPPSLYVLVFRDPAEDLVVLYRLPIGAAQTRQTSIDVKFDLYRMSLQELARIISQGSACQVSLIAGRPRAPRESGNPKSSQRQQIMSDMLLPDTLAALASQDQRAGAISAIAASHSIPKRQVRRLFVRLLESGLNEAAAKESRHHRSGKYKHRFYGKKQGRPKKIASDSPELAGRNVQSKDLEQIRLYSEARAPSRATKAGYLDYLANFAGNCTAQTLESGYVVRATSAADTEISEGQFRYHLENVLVSKTLGATANTLPAVRYRKVLRGHARQDVRIPGQRLLIDSTLADVYLVCTWDRSRIIGRPYVYAVMDAATSAIVGLHVTLHPPSAREARLALYKALTPKHELLRMMKLDAWEHLYPAACLPVELYADRGELLSAAGRQISAGFSMILKFSPPYTPEWKGIVERHFRFLNETSIHWTPGSTKGRLRCRGEPDVRLDATLTLAEFTKLITVQVLKWNKFGKPALSLRPELMAEGVDPGPSAIYEWGLNRLHGSPRYVDRELAVIQLLDGHKVEITEKGITQDHVRWYGSWMEDKALWQRRVMQGAFHFFKDPLDTGKGWACSEADGLLREVALNTDLQIDSAWTEEDLQDNVHATLNYRETQQLQGQTLVAAISRTSDNILSEAAALTKLARASSPKSKRARISGIRANRRAEVSGNTRPAAIDVHEKSGSDTPSTTASNYDSWASAF